MINLWNMVTICILSVYPVLLRQQSILKIYQPLDHSQNPHNRIGGLMVNVLASSVVDRGFEPQSGQTKDYKIGICCFSAKH